MDDERILAEFILTDGLHSGDDVIAIGERIGNRRTTEVMAAVFEQAMDRKYSSPPSITETIEYSKYLARVYGGDDDPVKPLVVEALMRVYNGESDLLMPFSIKDIIRHQSLISYDLFASLGLDENGLNDTVSQALRVVSELS